MDNLNRSLLAFYRRHRLIYAVFQQYERQTLAFWCFEMVLAALAIALLARL